MFKHNFVVWFTMPFYGNLTLCIRIDFIDQQKNMHENTIGFAV